MLRRFMLVAMLLLAPLPAFAVALSITASNVKWISGPRVDGAIAGEAITAGMAVYQKASDGKWYKAQCDGTAEEAGSLRGAGIALATADAAGALISVAMQGSIVQLGAGTAGTVYFVGGTAGAINPAADLASTNKSVPIILGIGSSPARAYVLGVYDAGSVVP